MPRENRRVRGRETRPREHYYEWNQSSTMLYLQILKECFKKKGSMFVRFFRDVYDRAAKAMKEKHNKKVTSQQLENRFRVLKRTYLAYLKKTMHSEISKTKKSKPDRPFPYADIMKEIFALRDEMWAIRKKKTDDEDNEHVSNDSSETEIVSLVVAQAQVHTPRMNVDDEEMSTGNTPVHNGGQPERAQLTKLQPRKIKTVKESLMNLDEILIDSNSDPNENTSDNINNILISKADKAHAPTSEINVNDEPKSAEPNPSDNIQPKKINILRNILISKAHAPTSEINVNDEPKSAEPNFPTWLTGSSNMLESWMSEAEKYGIVYAPEENNIQELEKENIDEVIDEASIVVSPEIPILQTMETEDLQSQRENTAVVSPTAIESAPIENQPVEEWNYPTEPLSPLEVLDTWLLDSENKDFVNAPEENKNQQLEKDNIEVIDEASIVVYPEIPVLQLMETEDLQSQIDDTLVAIPNDVEDVPMENEKASNIGISADDVDLLTERLLSMEGSDVEDHVLQELFGDEFLKESKSKEES